MFSIIYPYRNRDVQRVENSLLSLQQQTNTNFQVFLVNYGSNKVFTRQIVEVLQGFSFVNYNYLYTENQPWNKSKAINSVLKKLDKGCFFVADIDMIFHSSFVDKALGLFKTNEAWYFQVGFLSELESKKYKKFEDYKIKFKSNHGATGLTMCSVKSAKAILGFDEFYHFWGSEDTDFHVRLENSGLKVNFYDDDILLLHQWHKIYRKRESEKLTQELQVSGVVQFNHYYLKQAINNIKTLVNNENWGVTPSKKQFEELLEFSKTNIKQINTSNTEIDYFLFIELPNLKKGLHSFIIQEERSNVNFLSKAFFKSIFKTNKNLNYTLKAINDKLLFHMVSFYKDNPYNYTVSRDLKSIMFVIHILN